jgi:hypothetical protein
VNTTRSVQASECTVTSVRSIASVGFVELLFGAVPCASGGHAGAPAVATVACFAVVFPQPAATRRTSARSAIGFTRETVLRNSAVSRAASA